MSVYTEAGSTANGSQSYSLNLTADDGTSAVISMVSCPTWLKAFVFSGIYRNNLNSAVFFGISLAYVFISADSGTNSKGNHWYARTVDIRAA